MGNQLELLYSKAPLKNGSAGCYWKEDIDQHALGYVA